MGGREGEGREGKGREGEGRCQFVYQRIDFAKNYGEIVQTADHFGEFVQTAIESLECQNHMVTSKKLRVLKVKKKEERRKKKEERRKKNEERRKQKPLHLCR